ncbi:MAG: hypothetical protein QOH55_2349 [Microbacteriaceae bacterium]|nr:hypothetical protein [Microbacteriaceae bacterium]
MFAWKSWIGLPIAVVIALLVAALIASAISLVVRGVSRRRGWPGALSSKARHPFRLLIVIIALWIATALTFPDPSMLPAISHGFLIAAIAAGTWFAGALLSFAIGLAMGRYRTDVPDNRIARRLQTQLTVVRRLGVVVVVIIGIASILLTFPGVQAVGASVLASAGVVSVVAGLAAQSTLANVFAGVQLAFSDAIRVDDVVIAEGEWGKIEEITLSYVVVHIWDDRRLVLPSTYFTTTPFENWTRRTSELLGSVEIDLDWRVSPALMRTQLEEILGRTPLWDKRASVLQVTDATGGYVRVRILVTAIDAPSLFDLRCFVREEMVEWLHTKSPAAIPRTRVQMVEQESRPRPRGGESQTEQGGLFTGTAEAEERASQFTAATPIIEDPVLEADELAPR